MYFWYCSKCKTKFKNNHGNCLFCKEQLRLYKQDFDFGKLTCRIEYLNPKNEKTIIQFPTTKEAVEYIDTNKLYKNPNIHDLSTIEFYEDIIGNIVVYIGIGDLKCKNKSKPKKKYNLFDYGLKIRKMN